MAENSSHVKVSVAALLEQQSELRHQLHKIDTAVAALQSLCTHEFVYQYHDSHRDYFECRTCSKEDWR